MDTRIGEVRRIHVVYILSRGGHLEHPHLIKVHPVVRNGVRLRDVKRWLSNLRGKDMPNSFSWSYKRRYKSGYLWQDLCDDDLITPICDNEYVLKGSQISPTCQDTCTCGGKAPAVQKSLQNKNGLKELVAPNVLLLELDSSEGRKNYEQNYNNSDVESCKEMHSLKSNDDITLRYDEIHEVGEVDTIECATKTSGNTPSKVFNGSGDDEAVKVYKAIRNLSNIRLDAATQTGESTRCSDKEETLPLLGVIADAVSPKPVTAKKKTVGKMISSKVMPEDRKFTSKFTCMGNDVVSQPDCNSENIIKSATKESRQAKAKSSTTASHVLRQLFSCGGIDTRDGGIHNVKALEFNRSAIDEGSAGTAVSLASTPSKKLESQTNSMIFGRFSELLSANNLSVTNCGQSDVNVSKKSEGSLERQSSFVEAVANTAGDQKLFEELHLPLTGSGEYSSEKSTVDIPSAYGNSYSRAQFSGSPRVPPINIYGVNATKTTPKASTPSKKIQKGSVSPAGRLDDLSYWSATFPSSPRDDSRSSRKIKTPKGDISGSSPTAKHNLESYCLQCGRAVKPEYLNAHARYCRGQRNGKIDAKARTIMAKQSALGVQGEFAESYDRFPHSVVGHVVMPHSLF